jgi:hypothetical protein
MRLAADYGSAGQDLDEIVADLRGRVVDVARAYGGELEVVFEQANGREWLLGTQATPWRYSNLKRPDLRLSSESDDWLDQLREVLRDRSVEALSVEHAGFDLAVHLDDGSWLAIEARRFDPKSSYPYPPPPFWEIITPYQTVVAAGPGHMWSESPSAGERSRERADALLAAGEAIPDALARERFLHELLMREQVIARWTEEQRTRANAAWTTLLSIAATVAGIATAALSLAGVTPEVVVGIAVALGGVAVGALAQRSVRLIMRTRRMQIGDAADHYARRG